MTWIFPSLLDVPHKHFLKFKHEIVQMWEGRKPSKSRALPSLPQRAHEKVAQVSPLDRIGKNENELSELHPHLHQARAASEKELRGLRKFIVSGAPSRLFKTAPRRLALPSASLGIALLSCLALTPAFAKGAPEQKGLYDFSKGLDSYHSSLSLPDGYVQGSLNGFFDSRAPFEKRQGFTVAWSTPTTNILITDGINGMVMVSTSIAFSPIVIPSGLYSPAALASSFQLALNTYPGGPGGWTVAYTGGFFVISSTKTIFIFNFGPTTEGQQTGLTLGFNAGFNHGNIGIITAQNPPIFYAPPFQNLWTYTDATNTTWQIARTPTQIIANNLSGSLSVVIATVSANNLVGETSAFGNAYFVDQSQGVYYWNGSNTVYISGSPPGSTITQFHNRLWVIGAAAPNGNQLYGSALYNGLLWTPNLNPNDPVQLTVGIQDNFDNITAIYVYLDTLYAFKHYATFALYGFDQTSFQISQITQECGCVDGGSIQTYGGDLKLVSLRGVEDFNGYTCTRISDPIKNIIDPAVSVGNISAQSWVQSQPSDWLSGSFVALDTTTMAPAIALTNKQVGNFPNGSFENNFSSWTAGSGWAISTSQPGTFIHFFSGGSTTIPWTITPFSGSQIALFSESFVTGSSFSFSVVYATNTSSVIATASTAVNDSVGVSGWFSTSLPIPSTLFGTSVKVIMQVDSGGTLISNPYQVSGTSITYSAYYAINGSYTDGSGGSGTQYWAIDNINMNVIPPLVNSSGSFKSQVHQISSINSWGNFSAQDLLSGGGDAIAFSICSSTNSNMSAPESCASQNINSQIVIGTGTYVQWYATFTVTAATQTPTLNSGTVQWFTGNRATPMASTIWDDRYWLSITTTTSDTSNDAVVVLSKSGAWSLFDIHAGGFAQYKNSLYHSDSKETGNVYLDNQGYSDNGSPINTYLFTKDYPMVNLAQDASIQAIYPTFSDQSNANISLSYFVDRNPTVFPLSSVNQLEYSNASSLKIPLGAGDGNNQVFGETFSFLVQQNDSNPMQFYGMRVLFSEREIQ